MSSFFTPANAALVAALLIAIGVEVPQALVGHIFEAVGGIVAVIGFFLNWRQSGS